MEEQGLRPKDEKEPEVIWFKDEEFELTWPIFHMLPHKEKKELANKFGYRTIGEFEEFMTLQRAVDETQVEERNKPVVPTRKVAEERNTSKVILEVDEFDADDNDDERFGIVENRSPEFGDLDENEIAEIGDPILSLPDDLAHHVLSYLPVDEFLMLSLVSPHWKHLTMSELVFKRLCERCYLQTTKRKQLNVAKFGGSYRTMLFSRPRVKMSGGIYFLKYAKVKKIQRDMFTEIPIGSILETIYYRYFYFLETGSVVYALTTSKPAEMIPRISTMLLTGQPDRAAVLGHYQMKKNKVVVIATQEWHTVKMEMTILDDVDRNCRFGSLSFDRHQSSVSGDFDEYWSRDLVQYEVPSERFRFLKDRRL